jgi:photosystem I P700 chlorophyll a apoprotein A1
MLMILIVIPVIWRSPEKFVVLQYLSFVEWHVLILDPSAQVVWPIVGQEILNDDVGGVF